MSVPDPSTNLRNANLEALLHDAEQQYASANPNSAAKFQQACTAMPGGNTRTALFYPPFPLTFARAEGSKLWDLDGHCYSDFLGEYSAGIYGHSHPKISAAVKQALDDGIVFGGPSAFEARLAALICERFASCDLVRFCNSGTEANLMALSAAREITGRDTFLAFKGGYHGGVLCFAPHASVMNIPYRFILADYNDLPATQTLIEQHGDDLAAILVEPMMGTSGCIPGTAEFLHGLQQAAQAKGIIFILDEVMTSRLAPGGLQQKYGLNPDLTSFGKYLGGGLTFGAFGGREDIMARFDPRRPDVFLHSGTYNNNVLTMAAGYAGLSEVFTAEAALTLNQAGDDLRRRLNAICQQRGIAAQFTGVGSLLGAHFTERDIKNPDDAKTSPEAARSLFHLFMIGQGFYVGRRGYISLSLALDENDYAAFGQAFESFADSYGDLLG